MLVDRAVIIGPARPAYKEQSQGQAKEKRRANQVCSVWGGTHLGRSHSQFFTEEDSREQLIFADLDREEWQPRYILHRSRLILQENFLSQGGRELKQRPAGGCTLTLPDQLGQARPENPAFQELFEIACLILNLGFLVKQVLAEKSLIQAF